MIRNDNTEKKVVKIGDCDKYLNVVFLLKKRADALVVSDKKARFNDTELRLLGEIIFAEREGKRLISTQLATRLGVTRSAISQIVNRLEANGVIEREPDAVDRKIAYIVMTEETADAYNEELKACKNFIGKVVKKYGVEKFNELCGMMNEFFDTVETTRAEKNAKK